jgi:hypothetical protein
MRAGWLYAFVVLLCMLALAPVPLHAQDGTGAGAAPVETTLAADSWLGGLAAVGCGVMVRATVITAGTQVGTIIGAVACCGYVMFDLLVVDPR